MSEDMSAPETDISVSAHPRAAEDGAAPNILGILASTFEEDLRKISDRPASDADAGDSSSAPDAQNADGAPAADYGAKIIGNLSPAAVNTAYFNIWRQLILSMCVLYIRRYPDRVSLNMAPGPTPICCDHIRRALEDNNLVFSSKHFKTEHEQLDQYGIPTLNQALKLMKLYADEIDILRSAARQSKCALHIEHIRQAFNLNTREFLLLMTVALCELDDAILRCMKFASGDMAWQKFDAQFICEVCAMNREDAMIYLSLLSDRGQLIRMRLIIPERPYLLTGVVPRSFAVLAVDQRVLDALCGADLHANLSPHMRYIDCPPRPRGLTLPEGFLAEFKTAIKDPKARIILTGAPHSGRLTTASACAKSCLKQSAIAVDLIGEIESLPEDEIEAHVCDALREALLLGAIVVFRFDGLKEDSRAEKLLENHTPPLLHHIENYPGRIIVTALKNSPKIVKLFGNPIEYHIPMPTPAQQEKVWREALCSVFDDSHSARLASSFSNNYNLTVGQIFTAVTRALDAHEHRAQSDPSAALESHHILEEIRQCFSHDLASLADVVLSDVPIDRVILPEPTQKTVTEILNFARYQRFVLDDWGFRKCSAYGNSLSILFSGPPGTGKTLLATAMANELGKILYRVDLSRIVDKYVGETEKNLAKIFDEAAKAQAILLFDEADSLFAKRTDVKSSNDRYANLEVNFLIQKLESYEGISILTTNLQTSIDEAFKRRLRYIVEFKEPDAQERKKLWQTLIAPQTPLDGDIKWAILADNFELSGGHIRNATLNASIRAAACGKPLGMQFLLEAAIAETQKLGKLVKLSDKILLMLDDYGVEV